MKIRTIQVKNLTHTFDSDYLAPICALKNVNLGFLTNKITAIIGSSASGKTVLLKHLNGLLIPTVGQVTIGDFIIQAKQKNLKNINQIRQNIGFVFQFAERQLFEETVEKDIIFGPLNFGFSKKEAKKNALKYLQLLGLDKTYLSRSPFELSGGEKRKVAVAGIFAYEPNFILFDQLTAGFDLSIKNEFLNLLIDLKDKMQKTIIFTSNNTDDVLQIADQVIVLNQGEVIRVTTPQELFWDFAFCQKLDIFLPKTIAFLKILQETGFSVKNLQFNTKTSLINHLVTFFQPKLIKGVKKS